MPKVIGPLHSQGASGQFANDIVFVMYRGQPVVRSYVVPSNPNSDAQRGQRAFFGGLAKLYPLLSADDKATWDAAAAAANYDPRNAFASANLARFKNGQLGLVNTPTIDPAATVPGDPQSSDLTQVGTIDTLSFTSDAATGNELAMAIMAVPNGDPTPTKPTKANLLAIIPHVGAQAETYDHDNEGVDLDYYVMALGQDAQNSDAIQITAGA